MFHRVLSVAVGLCTAVWLLSVAALLPISAALAQSNDGKPSDQTPGAGQEQQKVDEYAEAQRLIAGPAGNPECVWFGRRVVALLLRDDLDTAFRHIDLYDRFGCPNGHIQAAFRCLVLQRADKIDPKATDTLDSKAMACWINPALPAAAAPPATPPAPSAAAPSPTTNR